MDKATNQWFKRLNEDRYDVLNEATLHDFGLPELIIQKIETFMHDAGNKSQIWVGNQWKEQPADVFMSSQDVHDVGTKWYDEFIKPLTPEQRMESNPDYKKAKFIIQNIKNAMISDEKGSLGRIPKALKKAEKALRKNGLLKEAFGDEFNKMVDDYMEFVRKRALANPWNDFFTYNINLINFLKQDPTNYEYIKGKDFEDEITIEIYNRQTREEDEVTFDTLDKYAEYLLSNTEFEDQILHRFDDNYYWYDLRTSKCSKEGERMGHCGADDRGNMYSLRWKKKDRKWSSSMVTISAEDDTIYQIKGRDNNAPPEEVWDHIVWFIDNMDIDVVKEGGEYSDDVEGIQEMVEYLSENTTAEYEESMESRANELQERLDMISTDYNNAFEHDVYVSNGDVEVDDEYLSYWADAGATFDVPLGWTESVKISNTGGWAPKGEEEEEKYHAIPAPNYDDERDFMDSLNNALGDAHSEEVEWEVHDEPEGAILRVRYQFRCDDCGSDYESYDSFAHYIQTDVDDRYEEIQKNISTFLADEGYAPPREWPTTFRKLISFSQTLQHFSVDIDPEEEEHDAIRFWLAVGPQLQDTWMKTDIVIPPEYFQKIRADTLASVQTSATAKIFGGRGSSAGTIQPSPAFQTAVQDATKKLDQAAQKTAHRQMVLPGMPPEFYRREYKETGFAEASTTMIDATQVRTATSPRLGHYPMELGYRYAIDFQEITSKEQIKAAMAFMEYMDQNNNVEHLKGAIEETIKDWVKDAMAIADRDHRESVSPQVAKRLISQIIDTYSQRDDLASDERVALARWADVNFDSMTDVEKSVLITQYLAPVSNGMAVSFWSAGELDYPANWVPRVRTELERLGSPNPRDYKAGLYQESMEEQIARIDRLLNETGDPSYDLRMYRIQVTCAVDKAVGGTDLETEHEIRGIWGVTTVEPDAKTRRDISTTAIAVVYSIKFKLHGQESRRDYVRSTLIPGLRKIRGLRILKVSPSSERINKPKARTIGESRIMKEYGGEVGGFGGMASSLGAQREMPRGVMPTPRPLLKDIIADWAEGGVQLYDAPVDSTDMRYTVMMPTEELQPLLSRDYRGGQMDFDGRYQQFISRGADAPVYLAIGQNGRAKITGNEDIVWFAKESGLEEVPVFISYQRQA